MNRIVKITAGGVVVAAALGGYWTLALAPKKTEIGDLNASIVIKEQKLSEAQGELKKFELAKANYAQNYADVTRLGKAVTKDDDVRSLVVQLQATAAKSGVDFRTIKVGQIAGAATPTPTAGEATAPTTALPPGVVTGSEGLNKLGVTFAFKGTYSDLSKFVTRVDQFVRITNKKVGVTGRLLFLEGVKLEPDSTGFPHIRATIGATSYLLAPITLSAQLGEGAQPQAGAEGQPATGAQDPAVKTANASGVDK